MNGNIRTPQDTSHVIAPNNEGIEIEITDNIPIMIALFKAYTIDLTYANTTPCITVPLGETLGAYSTWELANDILLGNTASLDGVDEATMKALKYVALKGGTQINNNLQPILASEFQNGLRKAKECISSAMRQ